MPDQKARAQAFWAEVFNEHDLSAACGFVAPGFVNRNARPGTPAGPFHGIPATHRSTAARHIHVLTFDETGLITEHVAVRDDVTVFRQLGALPAAMAPTDPAPAQQAC
jgi:hypothetical protein